MSRLPRRLSKRRTVLGVPMGKRRADWAKIGNMAVLGIGAVSTAVGGARALQDNLPKLRNRLGDATGSGSESESSAGESAQKRETVESGS